MFDKNTDIQDAAWGVPLKEMVIDHAVAAPLTGPLSQYATAGNPDVLTIRQPKPIAMTESARRLRDMCQKIEADIAYFGIYKGQAMAQNKLGIIKFDLMEIVKLLEQ